MLCWCDEPCGQDPCPTREHWLEVEDSERWVPDTFSISDAKNEEGEWIMSPEQIRAEMWYDDDY